MPDADEAQPFWRPPLRAYEQPPSRPVPINQRERREALAYWQARGVLEEQGQVVHDWRVVLGSLFDPG